MSDFIDSQKIIYELKPLPKRVIYTPPDGCKEAKPLNDNEFTKIGEIPFVRLLGGKEPLRNVKIRSELYKKNWERQMRAIDAVLSKTDRFKFRSLREFLRKGDNNEDYNNQNDNDEDNDDDNCFSGFDNRLTTALLNLGSNISNHDRLLNNVCRYLREDEHVCLVKINPNVCFNIQRIIKRIEDSVAYKVHEIIEGHTKRTKKKTKRNGGVKRQKISDDYKKRDEEGNCIKDEENINFLSLDEGIDLISEDEFDQELNNKFDILPKKIEKDKYMDIEDLLQVFKKDKVKLIVLIQNADAMSSILIEQTLMLLHRFNLISEVYALIGISTPFIIFQEKVSKILIGKLKTKTFAVDNSNEAINQIMEDLLLNINETYNSLIFDPKLVLKFLYKRDVMSIQQFNNYMKLIYMRHYYSQPLSLFWTNNFSKIDLNNIYFKIFKTLPSVMENSNEIEKKYLIGIIENDVAKIGELLRKNLNKLINWRFNFRNLIDFLNFSQASLLNTKVWTNNLELFQLLFEKYYELRDDDDNNDDDDLFDKNIFKTESDEEIDDEEIDGLDNDNKKKKNKEKKKNKISNLKINPKLLTKFLDELWYNIRHLSKKKLEAFHYQLRKDDQFHFISRNLKFPKKCPDTESNIEILIESIQIGLRDQVCELDLDNQAFREICVVRDDVIWNIHDAFEPCVRENCLQHLDEPGKILFNSKHWILNEKKKDMIKKENEEAKEAKEAKEEETIEQAVDNKELMKRLDMKMYYMVEPILCEMYRILKETGVIINVYDFYQVFKNSVMNRKELIKIMRKKLQDKDYIKSFKIEDISSLEHILEKIDVELENNIEDEWNKLTLAWFLKSISEFQMLGLLKEGKNKSQSIEKIIWRGI